jgi:hypothetical protein
MADRVSARRGTANAFFVSVQAAIVAALGFLSGRKPEAPTFVLAALCGVGVLSTIVWYLLLRSYRDLNTAKFNVIINIEKRLPVKVFTDEWETLKKDPVAPWRKRYAELGSIERIAPILFGGINIAVAVYLVTT